MSTKKLSVLSEYRDEKLGLVYLRVTAKQRPNRDQVLAILLELGITFDKPVVHVVHLHKSSLRPGEAASILPGEKLYEVTAIDMFGRFWLREIWQAVLIAYHKMGREADHAYLEEQLPEPLFPLDEMPKVTRFWQNNTTLEGQFTLAVCNQFAQFLPLIKKYLKQIQSEGRLLVVDSKHVMFDNQGGEKILILNEDNSLAIMFHKNANWAHFHVYNPDLKAVLIEATSKKS